MYLLDYQLEEFRDARRNAFLSAYKLNSEEKLIAGIYGVNIPREILWALDIVPINIYGIDESNIEASYELKEMCNIIKASYGYVIMDKCPFAHFSDILIGNNICKDKSDMLLKIGNIKKNYILSNVNSIDSLSLEYKKFAHYLEHNFNIKLNDIKLSDYIKKTNDLSRKMIELLELYMLKPNIINCKDLYNIIYGCQFILDIDERYKKLSAITETIKSINSDEMIYIENQKRIIINGSTHAGLIEKILNPLSNRNNISAIIIQSFCEGESLQLADENIDPYISLAEKYLHYDSFNELNKLVNKFKADAVININVKGCHIVTCRSKHKPNLIINTDYYDNDNKELNEIIDSFINNL